MDTLELVGIRLNAGRRLVLDLVRDGFEIAVAFWVKTFEDRDWQLYIATPSKARGKAVDGYRRLQAALELQDGLLLSLTDVRLIDPEDPIVLDARKILARSGGRSTIRYQGTQLGRLSIEGAYIYPARLYEANAAGKMPREEILRELVRLMDRGPGILESSVITLRDDSDFGGVPVAIRSGREGALFVEFDDNAALSPRLIDVDEIARIS